MDIANVLALLGGIGLFLYGMNVLGKALEKIAGAGLEKTLERLTGNKFKGILLGTAVTCVIQSSAATSVMVIGFLNAGIMKLAQAIPVIMGANIGTTITAQILRLGDISTDNMLLYMLKPSSFAPLCIILGAAIMLISKRSKIQNIASIIIGFGVLFFGMTTMESALAPLKDSEAFHNLFLMFENPLLGVAVGMLITAVLQSSSASVGMLQAMSSTGQVTFAMALPIVIGMNIGKCVTVLIASIGTNKKAKRAVLIDVMNNVIGAAAFLIAICLYQQLVGFSFWNDAVTRGDIANFHSLFNIVTTLLLLPFCGKLIKLSGKLIRDTQDSKMEQELQLLDELFLKTPSIALNQCHTVMGSMVQTALENFDISCGLLTHYDEKMRALLEENEHFLDKTETVLGEYVMKITTRDLDTANHKDATEIMHSIGDFERIGDYCINIADVADYNANQNVSFSDEGNTELYYITAAVREIIDMTAQAYQTQDPVIAYRIEPLEEAIDELVDVLKSKHVERLQNGICNMQKGISFVEILTHMERISDHCSNVAVQILKKLSHDKSFDPHAHLKAQHQGVTEEYRTLYQYYRTQFCVPVEASADGAGGVEPATVETD